MTGSTSHSASEFDWIMPEGPHYCIRTPHSSLCNPETSANVTGRSRHPLWAYRVSQVGMLQPRDTLHAVLLLLRFSGYALWGLGGLGSPQGHRRREGLRGKDSGPSHPNVNESSHLSYILGVRLRFLSKFHDFKKSWKTPAKTKV